MVRLTREPLALLFADIRETNWHTLLVFVVLHSALMFLFFSDAFQVYLSRPLFRATGGLITHTLLTNLVELVVLVGGVMLLLGGLRLKDLGLSGSKALNALLIMFLLWGMVQLATVLIGQMEGVPLALNPSLFQHEPTALLGKPLEATFGSALVEEISYRGFLLPQLFLLSAAWWPAHPKTRLAFALLVPQLYFGINHIPAGLGMHMPAETLFLWILHVTLVGIFFAVIYLRTDNLFVAIGVHALLNNPLSLFVSDVDPALFVLVYALILLLTWPMLARQLDRVFTMRSATADWWRHTH